MSSGETNGGGSSDSNLKPDARNPKPDLQIPLHMVANIRFVEGPNAIKAENGRLRNYVMLNVRDRTSSASWTKRVRRSSRSKRSWRAAE